ncbi:MAG: esterase-like activity of phytase family protein [Caldilineaceae bacterium]
MTAPSGWWTSTVRPSTTSTRPACSSIGLCRRGPTTRKRASMWARKRCRSAGPAPRQPRLRGRGSCMTASCTFVQSPLDNPDTANDANSKASTLTRIIAFDTAAGATVGQYLYQLDGGALDKIGDAVALPDGDMLVIERDSAVGPGAQKLIYKVSLAGATNLQERDDLPVGPDGGLERQSALGLARAGIVPAAKSLYVDLGALGYTQGDKPEGLALVGEDTLAVINDNDFGLVGTFDPATGLDENPAPVPVVFGLIDLRSNGLDASDRDDAINIRNWPVLGMYMPDAIAAYEVDGALYLITANEGDARDYEGYSEETRVKDLVLDLAAYPNAVELQDDANLGRLRTSTAMGDADGDGLVEQIYSFGARSFTIWDAQGNVVWDSGDELSQIVAAAFPMVTTMQRERHL